MFGVDVLRDTNVGKYMQCNSWQMKRTYYTKASFKGLYEVMLKQILVFNVYFVSSRKLAIIDEEG